MPNLVLVDVVGSVDVHGLVGIDRDADLADVGVDQAGRVTRLQVGQEALHVDLRQEDKVPNPDLKYRKKLNVLLVSFTYQM